MSLLYILYSTALTAFVFLLRWFLKYINQRSLLKKLPGHPGRFLIGNIGWVFNTYSRKAKYEPAVYILERMKGSCEIFRKWGVYAFWVGPVPVVSVFSPNVLEMVLSSNVSLEKSFEYYFLQKWLGLGLLTSSGSRWRTRRKLLTPSFHFRILEDFLPTFNEQSMVLTRKLHSLVDKEYVDISPLIVLCTLDIVCETVMGCSIGAQEGENSDYVTAIHNLADFFNRRSMAPWLWSDTFFGLTSTGRGFEKDLNILHSFTRKVIKDKKNILQMSPVDGVNCNRKEDEFQNKKRQALMDLLLYMQLKGEQLTEADIQEEVDTFMFEGHDTTAMGTIFALYCIGLYPEIQKKLYDEIESVFGDNLERKIEMDDIRNMKYLECTIKESQRLFPPVPIIGRKLSEDLHYDGMVIPNGTTLHCSFISLHMDPEHFPNPEIFDPDRFLPENSSKRHPYSFIPFSAGPRNCIGQKFALLEEKVIVCNILRNFKIISLDQRDTVQLKVEFTLRPALPMRLKFVPRKL